MNRYMSCLALLFLFQLPAHGYPVRASDEDKSYYLRLCTADPAVVRAYEKVRNYEDPNASQDARIEAILEHSTALYACIERKMREKNNQLSIVLDQQKRSTSFVVMPHDQREEVVMACNNDPLMGVLYQALRASDTPNVPKDERIRAIVTWSGAFYDCISSKETYEQPS